jgi:hypothetical protein
MSLSGSALAPGEGPAVCPECGQPYNQPPPSPDMKAMTAPLTNFYRHPPWEQAGGPLEPIWRESWLYRPFSVGAFAGVADGSQIVDNRIAMGLGANGGIRFGWDLNHYWGTETRFSWSTGELTYSDQAKAIGWAADNQAGIPLNDPVRDRFENQRGDLFFWDLDLLYYPWGDSRWRPYVMVGLGLAELSYVDRVYSYDVCEDHTVFAVPVAIGVKYRWNDWIALRLEGCADIAFATDGMNALRNTSLTFGLEIRCGGTRKAYWPWNPGRHYW